jgi:hypothetical protein
MIDENFLVVTVGQTIKAIEADTVNEFILTELLRKYDIMTAFNILMGIYNEEMNEIEYLIATKVIFFFCHYKYLKLFHHSDLY